MINLIEISLLYPTRFHISNNSINIVIKPFGIRFRASEYESFIEFPSEKSINSSKKIEEQPSFERDKREKRETRLRHTHTYENSKP